LKECGKTIYELVLEASLHLGKNGKHFTTKDVIKYIRENHPECKQKDISIRLHLNALCLNNPKAAIHHPSLYKRAFLIKLAPGIYKIAKQESSEKLVKTETIHKPLTKHYDEETLRKIISEYLKIPLTKAKVNICGKYKEFDIVNIEHKIVGDIKYYKFKGSTPSAEFSTLSEYVWLMEKLEKCTNTKWRKIIVGAGNKRTFEEYAKRYGPWLEDLEIYFIDENNQVQIIRNIKLGI